MAKDTSANNPVNTRIAVTGATGFIGLHLIRQALDMGFTVRAMVRNAAKLGGLAHEKLELHAAGLGVDDGAFVKDCDVVIHLAGLIKARNRAAFDAVNVAAAKTLAYACEAENIKRFIHVSSMTARAPELSDYAASKHAGELAVKDVVTGALAIIRAPAVFGPGDEATAPFIELISKGWLPTTGGSGWKERKLALVAVEDIARDILTRAISGDYDGKTVSPCNVEAITWPEFGEMAAAAAGHNVRVLPLPLLLLYPISALTSLTSRWFNKGHLTLGKLREFLYDDWSSVDVIQEAPPMVERLRATLTHHIAAKE